MDDRVTNEAEALAHRTSRMGLLINILIPGIVALAAFGLREAGIGADSAMSQDDITLLFYILGAVAIGEMIAAFVVRRQLLSPQRVQVARGDAQRTEHLVLRTSAIVFALGGTPMFYGAVLYLQSGDIAHLAFFGIVTLLTYRLLRPTRDFLEGVLNAADSD